MSASSNNALSKLRLEKVKAHRQWRVGLRKPNGERLDNYDGRVYRTESAAEGAALMINGRRDTKKYGEAFHYPIDIKEHNSYWMSIEL